MKVFTVVSVILLCFSLSAVGGKDVASAADLFQQAKLECGRFDEGQFSATDKAITMHDFTGDGRPEEVIDASQFSCSTAASMWGGSGGRLLWVLVDGKKHEFLAHKWQVVDVDGQKVLLLAVHSSECSDIVGPCYRALVWSDGFRTVR